MTQVTRFNHFNVSVSDMDASIHFYSEVLGLSLRGRGTVSYPHLDKIIGLDNTEIEWAELDIPGGGLIELFRYIAPQGVVVDPSVNNSGTTHFALEVRDINQLHQDLVRAGVPVASPGPVEIPFGDWAGWRCLYAKDPDGITIELGQPPDGAGARATESHQ
jgi:lactoylglutathione lyase